MTFCSVIALAARGKISGKRCDARAPLVKLAGLRIVLWFGVRFMVAQSPPRGYAVIVMTVSRSRFGVNMGCDGGADMTVVVSI